MEKTAIQHGNVFISGTNKVSRYVLYWECTPHPRVYIRSVYIVTMLRGGWVVRTGPGLATNWDGRHKKDRKQ